MIGWWAGLLMWGQGASTDFGTAMYVIYAFALLAGAGGVSSARATTPQLAIMTTHLDEDSRLWPLMLFTKFTQRCTSILLKLGPASVIRSMSRSTVGQPVTGQRGSSS